jgi:hypothetical protein
VSRSGAALALRFREAPQLFLDPGSPIWGPYPSAGTGHHPTMAAEPWHLALALALAMVASTGTLLACAHLDQLGGTCRRASAKRSAPRHGRGAGMAHHSPSPEPRKAVTLRMTTESPLSGDVDPGEGAGLVDETERTSRTDPLSPYRQENPIPDADAYARAYHKGVKGAHESVTLIQLLLGGHDGILTDTFIDDFAARYATISLTLWPPPDS